jgi:hypothetical protein
MGQTLSIRQKVRQAEACPTWERRAVANFIGRAAHDQMAWLEAANHFSQIALR